MTSRFRKSPVPGSVSKKDEDDIIPPEMKVSLENKFTSETLTSSAQDIQMAASDDVPDNSAGPAVDMPLLSTFPEPEARSHDDDDDEPSDIRMEGIWAVAQDFASTSVWCLESTKCCGRRCLTGGERVVRGTASASETVVLCGIRPPQFLWYSISGTICDAAQLAIDLTAKMIFGVDDPSLCWLISFSLSIIPRHTSHRYLVFGKYNGGYWQSLGRMYGGYSISIIVSTVFNRYMIQAWRIPHYYAWLITLLWTGVVNFFILKKLWGSTRTDDTSKGKKVDDGKNTNTDPKINLTVVREGEYVGKGSPSLKTGTTGRRNIATHSSKKELIMV
mmetsp:Transcript_43897/g.86097  ORF Transcript_43897/g.86097 Transcript_43897/m.86097 type:complete len:332 (-) Transcript_43897:38-1033(-)